VRIERGEDDDELWSSSEPASHSSMFASAATAAPQRQPPPRAQPPPPLSLLYDGDDTASVAVAADFVERDEFTAAVADAARRGYGPAQGAPPPHEPQQPPQQPPLPHRPFAQGAERARCFSIVSNVPAGCDDNDDAILACSGGDHEVTRRLALVINCRAR
jgi:hypothetical protein